MSTGAVNEEQARKKTLPPEKDEPTFKRWVLAAGFIAFVSTETNP